ncbi:unnamed protein product [Lepeophtheirus salmonis]|uniref:(salmon louse) hypothetical protein n=1 Tax=Lepeophtheirus salmonis TaxID=72036 RepID=A0A7R8CY67_LEPSM|nr:unnamed protein product [Lepeophtheirus salmonis]CAF2967519.1 unnamed protein product [Lepeophtheirus salmonis]
MIILSIGKKMLLRIHKIGRNPSSPTPTSRGGQTPRTTPSFGREISTSPSTSFNKTPYKLDSTGIVLYGYNSSLQSQLTTAICIRRNTKYKIITLFLHPSSF